MANERWFPVGTGLPDRSRLGRLLSSGPNWQIYCLDMDNSILIARDSLADRWIKSTLLPDTVMPWFTFGRSEYRALASGARQRLEPVAAARAEKSALDGEALGQALGSLPPPEPKKRPIGFSQN